MTEPATKQEQKVRSNPDFFNTLSPSNQSIENKGSLSSHFRFHLRSAVLCLRKETACCSESDIGGGTMMEKQQEQKARRIVLLTHVLGLIMKAIGYFLSGSAVLMNESIHSMIDCINQGLLAIGENRAQRGRSELHQFGEGRATYFFSTVVAMTIFLGGGILAVVEASRDLLDPTHEVEQIQLVAAILFVSLFIEVTAVQEGWQEVKEQNKQKQPLVRFLKESRDSDLLLGFTENLFALGSVTIAIAGILLTALTNNPIFDSLGGILGGLLLIAAAVFLAKEFYSLLIGEGASTSDLMAIKHILADPAIIQIKDLRTLHLSPEELLIVADLTLKLAPDEEPSSFIDTIEQQIKQALPELRVYCYIESEEVAS